MGWIRVSDDFYDNDKLSEVGPLGIALYLAAMGFCNRKLSDGYFKKSKARLLLDFDGIGLFTSRGELCGAGVDGDDAAKIVIGWMVATDLWHEYGHDCDTCHSRADGGEPAANEYLIHDYLKFQPSRAEVEAKAEANRRRVESWREARKGGNADGNGVSNDVGNALHTDVVTPVVQDTPNPNPNPTPNNSLVTSGGEGYVSNARESSRPPKCPRHETNSPTPCPDCMRVRKWEEDEAERIKADEVAAQRQRKEARENCPRCHGTNTYELDGQTYKCDPHLKPEDDRLSENLAAGAEFNA